MAKAGMIVVGQAHEGTGCLTPLLTGSKHLVLICSNGDKKDRMSWEMWRQTCKPD